jgi:prepilin-type N-terminal cleavage/methylation domain-containing protein
MKKGFTILELLVVVVVIALLSVVISQSFFLSVRSNIKTETLKDVKQNGDYSLDVMKRMIQSARSFTSTPCVEQGLTPTNINSITITNPNLDNTTFTCAVVDGIARIASVSADRTIYLTNTNVTLVNPLDTAEALCGTIASEYALAFTCVSVGGKPDRITTKFTLRQANASDEVTRKALSVFEETITLRN